MLVKAEAEDTIVTKAFTGRTMRALRNKYQAHYDSHPELNKGPGLQTAQSTKDGCWDAYFNKPIDPEKAACPCGQNVACINSIQPAAGIVESMAAEATEILAGRVSHYEISAAKGLKSHL